jgi:hypothetical protein
MTRLPKTFLVAGAAAAVAIIAVIKTPSAQNVGVGTDPAKSLMEPGAASDPTVKVVNQKADATMTVAPDSVPMTDVDRKAAAAMDMGSSPTPAK